MGNFDCVEKWLSHGFQLYGRFLARHPFIVLFLSLSVAAALSSGLFFVQFYSDTEDLFTPDVSRAREEKLTIQSLFPVNFDNFYATRIIEMYQRIVWIIVTAKDGGSVLREDAMNEIFHVREKVISTTITDASDTVVTFSDLCGLFNGSCAVNPVLHWVSLVRQYTGAGSDIEFKVPYPSVELTVGEITQTAVLDSFLGDVEVEGGYTKSAKALSLMFFLRHEPSEMNELSGQWEDAVAEMLEGYEPKELNVVYYTSDAVDEAQQKMTIDILPYFSATFVILIMFAVASCMMKDWVLSKPWLASCGVVSAGLAILSCSGLLSYCGVPFNQVAASMPFVIVGIGLDDTFIMLGAWRRTNPHSSVETRMGEMFKEAAVSITITSCTDFIAFCAGAISPLPAVRTFCLYTGVAVIWDFFYQITFFACIMVFTGHREASNRHCYFCCKVLPRDNSQSVFYKIFCAGGSSRVELQQNPSCPVVHTYHLDHTHSVDYTSSSHHTLPVDHALMADHSFQVDHACMAFFKHQFAPVLTHPLSMGLVIMTYIVYAVIAVYGCCTLQEGLDLKNLAEEGSMTNLFFDTNAKYFVQYGPQISVMLTEYLDYWDGDTQAKLEQLVQHFEDSSYNRGHNFTEFWLSDFKDFVVEKNLSVTNKMTFLKVLQGSFLEDPRFLRYQEDINFDGWGDISSSRFLVATGQLVSVQDQSNMMLDMRHRADFNPEGLSVQVFTPNFIVFEQFVVILPNTLQNLAIALFAMLIVSLTLIPNPLVALLVTLCVASIESGVVGFMSLWGVSLDGISMINIILCIGFSVDFSAHICYSFVTQNSQIPSKQRTAESLYSLGFPILQSAVSTMLGVSALFASRSYIFITFGKILVLVMVFGMLHGLVFLPVLLTLLGQFHTNRKQVQIPPVVEREEEKVFRESFFKELISMRETNV